MSDQKIDLLTPPDPPPSYNTTNPPPPAKNPTSGNPAGAPPRPLHPLALPSISQLRTKRVILASASPRRKLILSHLGFQNVEIIPSTFAEDLPKTLSPFEYCLETATKKAQSVYRQEINNEERGEPALIVAADTIVVDTTRGLILEKPKSEAQHLAMLKGLRDAGEHKVYTAVAAMVPLASARDPGYALETVVEETMVQFDPEITDELIMAYVKTREGVDKAGGYGMQGLGSILVERIEGSHDNVIGLPLRATLKLIEKVMAKGDDEDLLGDDLLEVDEE